MTKKRSVESNLFRMYLTNLNNVHGFDWLIQLEYTSMKKDQIRREIQNKLQLHNQLKAIQSKLAQAYGEFK